MYTTILKIKGFWGPIEILHFYLILVKHNDMLFFRTNLEIVLNNSSNDNLVTFKFLINFNFI